MQQSSLSVLFESVIKALQDNLREVQNLPVRQQSFLVQSVLADWRKNAAWIEAPQTLKAYQHPYRTLAFAQTTCRRELP